MHFNNFTSNVLPTILVGVFITKDTSLSVLEAFTYSWEANKNKFKNMNMKPLFVLGYDNKHHFFHSHTYILKMHENMNEGKTFFWFRKAVEIFKNEKFPYHPKNGIVKMDTDCVVDWKYIDQYIIQDLTLHYYFGKR